MATMELKTRTIDLMGLLPKAEHQIYNMPVELLNTLLDQAEKNKKEGRYIKEEDMNQFIDSLK